MLTLIRNARPAANPRSIVADDRGLTTVEYVIVLVLISVLSVGLWKTFGSNLRARIGEGNTAIGTLNQGGGATP